MVKKIRLKFVIVTMTLLTVVFSSIFFINKAYRNYLYRHDVKQYLESIADSSEFYENNVPNIQYEYSAEFFLAEFDSEGNLLSLNSSDGTAVDNRDIAYAAQEIEKKDSRSGRMKSFVYVSHEDAEKKYILFAEIQPRRHYAAEIFGTTVVLIASFGLILWVSFYLSKFVTAPATKALEREKQFISDASHELKTPISAIILNAQAMTATEETGKHLRNILSEAERMNTLIKKLLTLACLDEAEYCMEKRKFSLSESCEEILLPFESLAFENNIDFTYDIAENIYYSGICDDIKQVISVLLDNAFKYTPEKGQIKVTLHRKNYRPVLTVYNTGEGISEEALPHIFDRFYCCEKSRNTHTNSFGLGLSIAKAIMVAHGGDLYAESQYGKYAQFTVAF
ncbi:MAG: sensor histidine kinase [Ruminococcus sp.]